MDKRFSGIDKELEEVLDTWKAAGFAVAVVEKDKIVYAKGFGYSDYENKVPADANTLFAIGSCTKAFTSSIMGILREEEKVDFDESPIKYIPELKFFNSDLDNFVTVKDMMCHRTGLPRHDFSWYLFPTDSRDSLMERIAHQEPFTGVRENWYYNNFMFLAQGVIAEKITGKSWEENVAEKLFKPLGMERSNLSINALKKSKNAALGYEVKDDEINKMDYYRIRAMAPAGSINSSVNEMAKWVQTWIYGGKFGEEQVIPANYASEAMSSQMVIGGGLPGQDNPDLHMSNYGYGWMMSSYRGHYRVEHGGNIDGFSASTCFFPSDSIGIIVLANQNGSAIPSVVRNLMADRMLGLEKVEWSKNRKEQYDKAMKAQEEASSESSKKEGTKPSHVMVEYTGTYSHPGYGEFELVVENDSLFAKFPLMKFWMEHYHYDVFEPHLVEETGIDTSGGAELLIKFTSNISGDVDGASMAIEPSLDPIVFKRTPNTIEVSADDLEKYVGEYEISGTTIKVYTKKETVLYVFVPGQPEYELLATGDHMFTLKILDGYKVEFVPNDDGSIGALKFIQPNGTFTATRK
jgi:CubicO group peptidase (beta-lactamase class C family)